jgi:hypothetical protein
VTRPTVGEREAMSDPWSCPECGYEGDHYDPETDAYYCHPRYAQRRRQLRETGDQAAETGEVDGGEEGSVRPGP